MSQRIFVKVTGFSDVERHALNTVFRLSEGREIVYSLWTPGAPDTPQVAIVDGQSYEAGIELAGGVGAGSSGPRVIWVGAVAPAHAWMTYTRPMRWSDVVKAMDAAFMPPPPLDFDLDAEANLDLDLSVFDVVQPHVDTRSALIIAYDLELRLYLRAKMASIGLTRVQEATTVAEAVEMTLTVPYEVVVLDLDLTGTDDWQLFRNVRHDLPTARIVLITSKRTLGLRIKARLRGAYACLAKPLHPGYLHQALARRG